jgi:hypothetical protein
MSTVLSQLLAPAMVVAISPFSIIIAIFVVLHTDRPLANGVALLVGRVLALAAVTALFLQLPRLIGGLNRPVSPRVLLVLGGILVAIGIWVWFRRDRMTEEPPWLAKFSRATVYYSVVASSTVAVPVLAYMAVGRRADDQLNRFKEWLHRRSGLVTAVILLAVGITLLNMGISELQTEGA